MYLNRYAKNLQKLTEIPPHRPSRFSFDRDAVQRLIEKGLSRDNGLLTEKESKDLIQAYGIPVNPTRTAGSEEEAVDLAREMGYPLAMKLLSGDISHKTDAGGVQLDLRNEEEVKQAYARIMQGQGNTTLRPESKGSPCSPWFFGRSWSFSWEPRRTRTSDR